MKLVIERYEEVNGFKIVKDDGRIGRKRPGSALCKVCKKEFECNIYTLRDVQSCGCVNPNPPPSLPKFINGFEVIKDLGKPNKGARRVIVKCKICKKLKEGQVQNFKIALSCGCLKGKTIVCSYKHSHERLFRIYKNMLARCYDTKHKSYHNYGNLGILVCKEWKNNPDLFCEWALENGYKFNLSIDRIDGKKGYKPDNCRWVTVTEQNRNARTNVLNEEIVKLIRIDHFNGLSIKDLMKKYNVKRGSISQVINNRIWKEVICQ